MEKLYFHIEALSPQGCGVALRNNQKFFVPFTLPGEEVEAEPVATKKNVVFCRLVRVIQSSPKRIEPKCRYFGQCGGCDLQHMAYEDQLEFKQSVIKKALTPHETRIFPIIPSPNQFNYRNRITLHTDGKQIGYYKPFSHEIVPIERCGLLADDGIQTTNDDQHIFTQINTSQNQNLIQTVLKFCSERKWTSALELYCGAGNLTFHLASVCKKIVAVDSDAEAIRLANVERHALKKNNIKFSAASAHDAVFKLVQDLQQFDLIICDPPREGLKETATLLPRLKPKQIVYVSCNPQTFVNDVKVLERSGYSLTEVVPIDMFPQTSHVEIVGCLVGGSIVGC